MYLNGLIIEKTVLFAKNYVVLDELHTKENVKIVSECTNKTAGEDSS